MPLVHSLPVEQGMPGLHDTHVPAPLQTPPEHATPAPTLVDGAHDGPPDAQPIAPFVHGFPVTHGMPVTHATHVPLPLQTPPVHIEPAGTLPANEQTGVPDPHAIVPVVHSLPVPHMAPSLHAMHVPLPLHTPPVHPMPAVRAVVVMHTGMPVEQPITPS